MNLRRRPVRISRNKLKLTQEMISFANPQLPHGPPLAVIGAVYCLADRDEVTVNLANFPLGQFGFAAA